MMKLLWSIMSIPDHCFDLQLLSLHQSTINTTYCKFSHFFKFLGLFHECTLESDVLYKCLLASMESFVRKNSLKSSTHPGSNHLCSQLSKECMKSGHWVDLKWVVDIVKIDISLYYCYFWMIGGFISYGVTQTWVVHVNIFLHFP